MDETCVNPYKLVQCGWVCTFTFMHLADAFLQSDLVHSGYTYFCQYMCSLGIEPITFALLKQCSTIEPQEHCRSYQSLYLGPLVHVCCCCTVGPWLQVGSRLHDNTVNSKWCTSYTGVRLFGSWKSLFVVLSLSVSVSLCLLPWSGACCF